jgi:hypothetical protein
MQMDLISATSTACHTEPEVRRCWEKKKTNDTPSWNAMYVITILEYTNILTLSLFFNNTFKHYQIEYQVILLAFIPLTLLSLINYYLLIKNTSRLVEKYKDENSGQKRRGTMLLIAYTLFSLLTLFFQSR